jgi:hypothetical protein
MLVWSVSVRPSSSLSRSACSIRSSSNAQEKDIAGIIRCQPCTHRPLETVGRLALHSKNTADIQLQTTSRAMRRLSWRAFYKNIIVNALRQHTAVWSWTTVCSRAAICASAALFWARSTKARRRSELAILLSDIQSMTCVQDADLGCFTVCRDSVSEIVTALLQSIDGGSDIFRWLFSRTVIFPWWRGRLLVGL